MAPSTTKNPPTSATVCADINRRLDDLEDTLPTIPSKIVSFNRALAGRVQSIASDVADNVGRELRRVSDRTNTAASTTVGQAQSAAERTVETAQRSAKQAAGQARAQAERAGGQVDESANALLDQAERAMESGDHPAALEDWTKAELYERAQELEIDGRSAMDKGELVAAIRAANR